MPASVIVSFADKSGKSQEEVERLYNKAKDIVDKQYEVESGSDDYYQIVMGVLKKMLGISEEITLSSIGGKTDGKADSDSYKYKIPVGTTWKDIERMMRKRRKNEANNFWGELDVIIEEQQDS